MRAWLAVWMLLTTILPGASLSARTWTDRGGNRIEAELVEVAPDRTVTLRSSDGATRTIPFSAFGAEDRRFLESRLAAPGPGREELNATLGMELWRDRSLWDDATAATAERLSVPRESKTGYQESFRAYPSGEWELCGEPVYSLALYGDKHHLRSLSAVLVNKGDVIAERIDSDSTFDRLLMAGDEARERIEEEVERCGENARRRLQSLLGEPERDRYGDDRAREKVWRWDWHGHALLLSIQEGEYVAFRVVPPEVADRAGRAKKISDEEIRARLAERVERRSNGDVVIRDIPMIDQGPKGYCVPATFERYLRYMHIPADMYILAMAGETAPGGGSQLEPMIEGAERLVSQNGRRLKDISKHPEIDDIRRYIDEGLPLMWVLNATPDFQQTAHDRTVARRDVTNWDAWARQLTSRREAAEDAEPRNRRPEYGHICLVIGYNEQTGEIAFSDSYGPEYRERWITAEEACLYSMEAMYVIHW
ncbi:hypothetical protein [Kiritimatiella glycovorans]|uniref:Peptidase C39-like domain-containing protein n=1 Tax=Kiritimatiella glycovorans TaxID=1307763 RepID=A0A0G3EKL5_9BACT|nr:hypothetical protein [Kiritimatiella glycovorans]AKJ65300.1 hypothetical protein L21SP4_02067 [Kiritimatiella glycovorans]